MKKGRGRKREELKMEVFIGSGEGERVPKSHISLPSTNHASSPFHHWEAMFFKITFSSWLPRISNSFK